MNHQKVTVKQCGKVKEDACNDEHESAGSLSFINLYYDFRLIVHLSGL